MKDILVKIVPANIQRYSTAGDYWEDDKNIHIRITKQEDEYYELLILIHELIEYFIAKKINLNEEEITRYDLEWEERYKQKITLAEEPGNEKDCPYRRIHRFSENIERLVCHELGIEWDEYNNQIKC